MDNVKKMRPKERLRSRIRSKAAPPLSTVNCQLSTGACGCARALTARSEGRIHSALSDKGCGEVNGIGAQSANTVSSPRSVRDTADTLTDQLEEVAADGLDGLLEPVRRLVAGATSYEEIMDGILSCYPDMDVSSFAETMKDALMAANLAGYTRKRKPDARQ